MKMTLKLETYSIHTKTIESKYKEYSEYSIWEGYENNIAASSSLFTIEGKKQPHGMIGYINGVGTKLEIAKSDASRLSNNLANNSEIFGIHNASQGNLSNILITPLLQGGLKTAPVKLLIDQWANFFNTHPSNEKFLQICYSQGAVHVKNALDALCPELRNRICVVAIAPAIFIPNKPDCQVLHFYKTTDPFLNYALGRSRTLFKNDPGLIRVDEFDGCSPHDPHSSNFVEAIKPYVQNYLEKNELFSPK